MFHADIAADAKWRCNLCSTCLELVFYSRRDDVKLTEDCEINLKIARRLALCNGHVSRKEMPCYRFSTSLREMCCGHIICQTFRAEKWPLSENNDDDLLIWCAVNFLTLCHIEQCAHLFNVHTLAVYPKLPTIVQIFAIFESAKSVY